MFTSRQNFGALALGMILFLGFGYFSLFAGSFLPVFLLIAYISYHKFNSDGNIRIYSRMALVSVFIASIVAFAAFSYKSYGPRDWDFTCFFLYGNVAAKGMNFYSPNDYYLLLKTIDIPIALNSGFIREVVDVGCPYPPPTLLLFSILGFFSYNTALMVWTIIINLFLIGSIALVKNIFFEKKGLDGIMISVILVLSFQSTLTTVFYSQILFLLLFFLLLFYKYRSSPWSGLFLAIAIFLKPFAVVLFFYLIIKREKKPIFFFIGSCLAICLVTALIFGFQPFMEYVLNNPNQRAPGTLFTESTNQSLLAELFRNLPGNKSLAKIIYYVVSPSLVLLFGILIYLRRNQKDMFDLFFVILLSVALIIYPSGQYNYPEVHLISIFILLNYLKRVDTSATLIFLFYLVSYAGLLYLNIFLLLFTILLINKEKFALIYYDISHSLKSGT